MAEQDKDRSNPLGFFKGSTGSPVATPPKIEAYRQKIIAREKRMKAWLDTMHADNPVRMVGEHVYAKMLDRGSLRLGTIALKFAKKEQARKAKQEHNQGKQRQGQEREP